jgi:DNA invertase Pin-like site-specific DNA recombinase
MERTEKHRRLRRLRHTNGRTAGTSYNGSLPGKDKNMGNRLKTAIYCRTALADDGKIAAQEARLRAYANEHGYTNAVCYRDNGAAGNTLSRPAMAALMADIKAGEIGAVLATDISRIARAYPLATEWHKLIRAHGTELVCR